MEQEHASRPDSTASGERFGDKGFAPKPCVRGLPKLKLNKGTDNGTSVG